MTQNPSGEVYELSTDQLHTIVTRETLGLVITAIRLLKLDAVELIWGVQFPTLTGSFDVDRLKTM